MSKRLFTRSAVAAGLATMLISMPVLAQQALRIGVMEDMSGVYSDLAGKGSVVGAQLAIDDFGGKVLGRPIELLSADHQNKADIASSKAREWYGKDGVGLVVGLSNSAAALAVRNLSRGLGKIDIVSSAGSSDITGKQCSPTGFHWAFDTYALGKTVSTATVKSGGDTWYFITADYAFGHAAQRDATRFIEAAGGKVLGSVKTPVNIPDVASFLLQAQASKAKIVGLAMAGGDLVTTIKGAGEFGLVERGQKMAGLVIFITDVHSLGPKTTQGLLLASPFYWDLNDKTRAWSARFFKIMGKMPSMTQVGTYSAVLHYLKAVQAAGTDEPGAVAAAMRALPVNDFWNKNVKVREDGRVLHDMHLFQVKSPAESKGPWDLYKLIATTSGDQAFRPINEGGCPFIK